MFERRQPKRNSVFPQVPPTKIFSMINEFSIYGVADSNKKKGEVPKSVHLSLVQGKFSADKIPT